MDASNDRITASHVDADIADHRHHSIHDDSATADGIAAISVNSSSGDITDTDHGFEVHFDDIRV